jgi:hypothetical protein
VDQSTGDTADEEVVVDEELDGGGELLVLGLEHGVELLGLGDGPGESIEDESARPLVSLPSLGTMMMNTHPRAHSLFSSSCCLMMPTMISSLTSPPWSMIFLASFPSSVPCLTCSRSMSPVARWQTLYAALMLGAWVPFPGTGRLGQLLSTTMITANGAETRVPAAHQLELQPRRAMLHPRRSSECA